MTRIEQPQFAHSAGPGDHVGHVPRPSPLAPLLPVMLSAAKHLAIATPTAEILRPAQDDERSAQHDGARGRHDRTATLATIDPRGALPALTGAGPGSPDRGVAGPATRFRPTAVTRLRRRLARRLVLLLVTLVFRMRLEIRGLEQLPPDEPLIVAGAPHRGWIDPFLIILALPLAPRVFFLGSAEAMFNTWWKRTTLAFVGGVVPVSTKGQLNRDGLETSLEILAAGNRLGIFPEGWGQLAQPATEIQPIKRGVAFLSQRSRRRVLPVGLAGTQELWRGKTLRLQIGPPLPALAPDADRAEAAAYADRIGDALCTVMPPLPSEPSAGAKPWPWLTRLLD